MLLDLQRAFTPEEMEEYECALCRRDFRPESVIAFAQTNDRADIGRICPDCLEHFGRANPELFLSIEEYRKTVRRYPEPIWANGEEADRAEEEEDFDYSTTFVWRSPL